MLRQAAVDEWNMGLSTADVRQRFQVVKFGLNYRFGWGLKAQSSLATDIGGTGTLDVSCWPKADIEMTTSDFRFRGRSGHRVKRKRRAMTTGQGDFG